MAREPKRQGKPVPPQRPVRGSRVALENHRPPMQLKAAAQYLGMSHRWLDRMAVEGRIPYVKTNWIRLFLADDLDRWLEENKVVKKAR